MHWQTLTTRRIDGITTLVLTLCTRQSLHGRRRGTLRCDSQARPTKRDHAVAAVSSRPPRRRYDERRACCAVQQQLTSQPLWSSDGRRVQSVPASCSSATTTRLNCFAVHGLPRSWSKRFVINSAAPSYLYSPLSNLQHRSTLTLLCLRTYSRFYYRRAHHSRRACLLLADSSPGPSSRSSRSRTSSDR